MNILNVGLAQISPVWLDRDKTLEKVCNFIEMAAVKGCELVVFGEALVPGYPFWTERTDGVITSYSIHYTKLYDICCVRHGRVPVLQSRAQLLFFSLLLFFELYRDVRLQSGHLVPHNSYNFV